MKPDSHEVLKQFLADHEFEFNEEYHALLTSERRLELLPADALETGSGWLLQYADTEAGEWNLARAFGTPAQYLDLLGEIPPGKSFQLLIPDHQFEFLPEDLSTNVQDRLIWHRDEICLPGREEEAGLAFAADTADEQGDAPAGTTLVWREGLGHTKPGHARPGWGSPGRHSQGRHSPGHENSGLVRSGLVGSERSIPESSCPGHAGPGNTNPDCSGFPSDRAVWRRHAYLMHEGSIAAMVRPVRVTPHSVEVYIETVPHLREKRLATWLLQTYRRSLRAAGRCLLYVVSSQNTASLRVAAHLGLHPYQTLLRITNPCR